jgi:hypothetical protein
MAAALADHPASPPSGDAQNPLGANRSQLMRIGRIKIGWGWVWSDANRTAGAAMRPVCMTREPFARRPSLCIGPPPIGLRNQPPASVDPSGIPSAM